MIENDDRFASEDRGEAGPGVRPPPPERGERDRKKDRQAGEGLGGDLEQRRPRPESEEEAGEGEADNGDRAGDEPPDLSATGVAGDRIPAWREVVIGLRPPARLLRQSDLENGEEFHEWKRLIPLDTHGL